jgi:hypothetical protein
MAKMTKIPKNGNKNCIEVNRKKIEASRKFKT